MARVTPQLSNFNAGEWSPLLWGRSDLAKYPNAGRRRQNMIPLAQGPGTRRPGTRYVASTRNDAVARLIGFVFSTVQAYLIEMGDTYFRFFKDRAQILSGGSPYEVTGTPYDAAKIAQVKWVQSADTLYLFHPQVRTRKLTRTGHTSWTLSLVDWLDGPYLPENTTATTLAPSATTGSVTITASATAGINDGAGFGAGDVNRLIRIKHGSTWGYAIVTAVTDTTHVTATVKSAFGGTTAVTAWRLGAWSDGRGWPSCGTFHEERLAVAGTPTQPQTVWLSRSGDFENMAPSDVDGTVADDHAISITVADDQVNAIMWLVSGDVLHVGTTGGEKMIRASSLTEALTPSNAAAKPQTTRGAADMMPVTIDGAVLFVQRVRRKLYQMDYDFQRDRHAARDMSLLADHLTRGKLKAIAWQAEPWGVLWAARDDGLLVGFTYLPDQEAFGWHRHPVGGEAGQAWGRVLSVAVVAGADQDEPWLIVERVINGATRRYVEFVEDEFRADDEDAEQAAADQEQAFFVDAGLTYDGWNTDAGQTLTLAGAGNWTAGEIHTLTAAGFAPFNAGDVGKVYRFRKLGTVWPAIGVEITAYSSPTQVSVELLDDVPAVLQGAAVDWWGFAATEISGAGHLEGETVAIWADGAPHPSKTVTGGMVTLDRPAVVAQLGLACPARLESLDLEAGSAEGSAQGKQKRVSRASVKFFQTLGAKVGHDDAHLEEITFRVPGDPMDVAPPLFTGDRRVEWPQGWDRGARVLVTQDSPGPLTVLSIAPQITTNDG